MPSRASQIATVAVAFVVLGVVGAVLLFIDPSGTPPSGPPTSTSPVVPPPPPSDFTPSRAETPPLPTLPNPLPTLPTCIPPAPVQLTLQTFNIHFGIDHRGRLQLDRIAQEIRTWNPDIVVLQEVDKGRPISGNLDEAAVLAQKTGLNHVYGGNSRNTGAGPRGNAILTRFPIAGSTNIHLPKADGAEVRGLLHAQLDVGGVPISVYATHFDHRSVTARREQAEAVVRVLAADPLPKLLGGDLNTSPKGGPVKLIKASGLGDVWAIGKGKGATVPAGKPGSRIDFLFHDGWFTPLQAEVLLSAVSDHRTVWSRLQFQPPHAC